MFLNNLKIKVCQSKNKLKTIDLNIMKSLWFIANVMVRKIFNFLKILKLKKKNNTRFSLLTGFIDQIYYRKVYKINFLLGI